MRALNVPFLLTVQQAAERVGKRRPQFSELANTLNLPSKLAASRRGGSPPKLYAPAVIERLDRFLRACRELGGDVVLRRLTRERP